MFTKENKKKYNYLFHYTKKENLKKILQEKEIRTFNDEYTFFAESYEDSCKLFKELMMKEIAYIDDKLTIQKRKIEDSNDYVILKIKVNNDNNFYRFMYEADGFNPYNYSILHKGNLKFSKCEILKVNDKIETNALNEKFYYGMKKLAITASISALLLLGNISTVNATSWEESNSYDTRWYNTTNTSFNISNANELAGLAHLVNSENVTFEGKTININNDINATTYTWKKISASFKGTIEGMHKVYIALANNDGFVSSEIAGSIFGITVINNYVIDTNISPNATIEPSEKILVKENENKNIKIKANTGYGITEVSIDGIKQTIDNDIEFRYTFQNVVKPHIITVKAEKKYTHIKNMKNSILNTLEETQITNYSRENPFNNSYTEIIGGIEYSYTYKSCNITDDVFTWNYETSILSSVAEETKTVSKDETPKTGTECNIIDRFIKKIVQSLDKYIKS